jgi:hypothetical protein
MKIKLLVSIAVLSLIAAPAMANLQIRMDSIQADLSVTAVDATSASGTISLAEGGILNVDLEDDISGTWQDLDNAQMLKDTATDNFLLTNLSFSQVAADVWTATGSLSVSDTVGVRVLADFTSNYISINAASSDPGDPQYFFTMAGDLVPQGSSTSILVNGGAVWTYVGEYIKPGSPDADSSNPLPQITVANWNGWNQGTLLELHLQVGTGSLDTFFTNSGGYTDGQLNVTITPIPGAILLGILGMGVAGLKLRKFA